MHKLRPEEHIAGFSMNTETENYLASTDFFFQKVFAGEIICTLQGERSAHKLQHTCWLHFL